MEVIKDINSGDAGSQAVPSTEVQPVIGGQSIAAAEGVGKMPTPKEIRIAQLARAHLEDDFFDNEIELKAEKAGLIQALEWGAKQVTK